MPEFLTLMPPAEALETLLSALSPQPEEESIQVADALGRTLAKPVRSGHPLPSFPRSTVDGYAVRAADTYGASEGLPAYLPLKGEVPMGASPEFNLQPGETAAIHTGGMLPEGADAVIMIEFTQISREAEVELLRSVAVGENVLQIGEDVREGEIVIPAGILLGPAEIGGAMALGVTDVEVVKKPRVGIISSGDEVIPPDREIQPGQVRDINSYTLQALIRQAGGEPVVYGIAADRKEALLELAARAHRECDLVVITAGSSASIRDLTAIVIDELGQPGVLVHGVNVRPGKPTILGVCEGKPVIGLPGNPVSALVIAGLFVVPLIGEYSGRQNSLMVHATEAKLKVNLSSQAGREDWVAVQVIEQDGQLYAEPVFGKSNLIFTLVRADGLIRIPADANGLAAGSKVSVHLLGRG